MALVAILSAAFATRGILAALRARWANRNPRRSAKSYARSDSASRLTFLGDALILTRHTLLQAADLLVHAKDNRDHDLAALVIDRLSLSAIHAPKFDATGLCPPDRLNAYEKPRVAGLFRCGVNSGPGRTRTCDLAIMSRQL